ncbi:MFS transporter [Vibrio vulnificus]
MKNNKFVLFYYISSGLLASNVSRGIFILYLLHVGLSDIEISVLQTTLFLGTLLLEIPSGAIADRYGRKSSLVISLIFSVIYGLGFLYFEDFIPFVVLFFLHGMTFAFKSGADQAMLYDFLSYYKKENLYIKINGRAKAIGAISMSLSLLLGGWIQDSISWDAVYITFVLTKILAIVAVLQLNEILPVEVANKNLEDNTEKEFNNDYEQKGFLYLFKKKYTPLFVLFVGFALFDAVLTPYYIYGQQILNTTGVSIAMVGLVYSLIEGVNALLYIVADKYSQKIKFKNLLILTYGTVSLGIYLTSITSSPLLIALIFIVTLCIPAFYDLTYYDYINKFFPSEIRATCISIESFINSSFIAMSYIAFGLGFTHLGTHTTIQTLSIIILIAMVGSYLAIQSLSGNKHELMLSSSQQ